jgi:hypothetical protein
MKGSGKMINVMEKAKRLIKTVLFSKDNGLMTRKMDSE